MFQEDGKCVPSLECMRKALELFVLGLLLKITLMELSGGNGERPIQIIKK